MKRIKTYKQLIENLSNDNKIVSDIIFEYDYKKTTTEEIIEKLNKSGVNKDLILLKSYNHDALIKYYLEQGANPNYITKYGFSPILLWVTHNSKNDKRLEIVKLLIKYGANINYKNRDNRNALYYAFSTNKKIIKYLLDNDSDIVDDIFYDYSDKIELIELVKNSKQYDRYLRKKNLDKFNI